MSIRRRFGAKRIERAWWTRGDRRRGPGRRCVGSPRPRCTVARSIVALALSWLAASAAFAVGPGGLDRDAPFEITADSVEYDQESRLYVADGHVRLEQGEKRLSADWVAFSLDTQRGVAAGRVSIDDGEDSLHAEFMQFDLQTFEGVLFQGDFDSASGRFRIQAKELLRYGEDLYGFRKGTFTTCRCPHDGRVPWQIRAGRADVEVGEYGTVQNATFDVLGVPILWIPWMFFPVKTERETGLLFPQLAYGSRNGFEVGLPFFWAARDDLNVTVTPNYLERRGAKPDLELEYVIGERSAGRLFGSWLLDREADADRDDAPFPEHRWAGIWEQDQFLPLGWHFRSDVKVVSDNIYPDDFRELEQYKRHRYLESSAFLHRTFAPDGEVGVVASATYEDDLQNSEATDRDPFVLQRWPTLQLDVLPARTDPFTGFVTALDVEAVRFSTLSQRSAESILEGRNDDAPVPVIGDDLFIDVGVAARPKQTADFGAGNGRFDEGEPLADRGERYTLHPRISRPFLFGPVEVLPEVGWQQTLYRTEAQSFAERGLLTGRLDTRLRLERRYTRGDGPGLVHRIEPHVGWALVARAGGQQDNPFFVPRTATPQRRLRLLDLESVTRDPSDRIQGANIAQLGVGQRFYRESSRWGRELFADVDLSVAYDPTDGGFQQAIVDGRMWILRGLSTRLSAAFDVDRSRLDEGLARLSWRRSEPLLPFVDEVGVDAGYRYVRRVPIFFENLRTVPGRQQTAQDRVDQIDGGVSFELFDRIRLRYEAAYSLEGSKLLTNRGELAYVSGCRCWSVAFGVKDQPGQGTEYSFGVTLLGLGDGGYGIPLPFASF